MRSCIEYTGAIAASAASNAASTSADDRAPTHADTIAVELVAMVGTLLEGREPRVVAVTEQRHHAVRDRLGGGRDRDPLAVGTPVGAARHRVRDARAETGLLVVEVRGRRRQRRHHLQHRLEQVHVDDLTLAAAIPLAQRDHHRERAGERGDLVGQRDRREERRAVGLAVDRREPAHRLGDRRESRLRRVGAVLAEAGDAEHDEPRVARRAAPPGRARAARCVPGRKFSTSTSAASASRSSVVAAGVGLEVEHDRPLVPTEQLPRVRVAALGREPTHAANTVTARATRPSRRRHRSRRGGGPRPGPRTPSPCR